MPKDNIDYSNTIIYKIYCIDEAITDTYVGHTTQFIQRKHHHKNACSNSKINLKIYKTIRENGGWGNWNMIEIAKYNCKDSTEARIKEQQHYEELKSTLNSCPPYVDKKKYFCIDCNLQCISPSQFNKHINCKLHSTTKPIETNDEIEDVLEKITTIKNDAINYIRRRLINWSQEIPQRQALITHMHIISHAHTGIWYAFCLASLFISDKQTFRLYDIKLSRDRLIQIRQRVVFINHQEFTVSALFIHFKNILGIWDSRNHIVKLFIVFFGAHCFRNQNAFILLCKKQIISP